MAGGVVAVEVASLTGAAGFSEPAPCSQSGKGSKGGPCVWALATAVPDPEAVPGSWLCLANPWLLQADAEWTSRKMTAVCVSYSQWKINTYTLIKTMKRNTKEGTEGNNGWWRWQTLAYFKQICSLTWFWFFHNSVSKDFWGNLPNTRKEQLLTGASKNLKRKHFCSKVNRSHS